MFNDLDWCIGIIKANPSSGKFFPVLIKFIQKGLFPPSGD